MPLSIDGKNLPGSSFTSNAFLQNLVNKYLGMGLTDAEKEANAFTAQQNRVAMDFSAQQAQEQMAFQERMANTQYQRGVQDMIAAGVNPALAYSRGGSVVPSGAAFSGSAGSSVSSGSGASMSDLMRLFTIRKEMKLMDAQIEDVKAAAAEKRASAAGKDIENRAKPQMIASQLNINVAEAERISADTRRLFASAEGQELANTWNPQLWQNELDNGRMNRAQSLAAIMRVQAELGVLSAQQRSLEADVSLKASQRVLNLAQAALARRNEESVSLDVARKEFANAFQQEFGTLPDQPIWSAVVGVLGQAARKGGNSIEEFLSGVSSEGPAFFNGLDLLGKKVVDKVTDNVKDAGNKFEYFKFKYLSGVE